MEPIESHPQPSAEDAALVVVGAVDTGINPYHDQFQAPGITLPKRFVDVHTGKPPIALRLAQEGTFDERWTSDERMWMSLEKGALYWFEGTRILAMSLNEPSPDGRINDGGSHGTEVASTLRTVSPEAWVVMIQAPNFPARNDTTFAAFDKAAEGIQWLAEQPWIDILSLSLGIPGNPPAPVWDALEAATRAAVQAGKVVVFPAGNEPSASIFQGTAGPPWVISAGGAEPSVQGEHATASKLVDVVADFTRVAAGREPDEYNHAHGTSFSAPEVAGNIAQALLGLRKASNETSAEPPGVLCVCNDTHLVVHDFREALNASAVYWNTTDWDPLNYTSTSTLDFLFNPTAPILPTPWVQMGWGYVGNDTWRTMVDFLQGHPPPAKPDAAKQYMAAYQAAREAYWAAHG